MALPLHTVPTRQEVLHREYGPVSLHLTDHEANELLNSTKASVAKFKQSLARMPTEQALTLLSKMGEGHRKWYQEAKNSLESVFGDEAPRFIALLAATSSRKGVKDNMRVASQIWKHYKRAEKVAQAQGRQVNNTDLRNAVATSHVERENLGLGYAASSTSDLPNVLIALDPNTPAGDATQKILAKESAHKIDSFRKNLLGNLQAVTNDAWIGHLLGKNTKGEEVKFRGSTGQEYHLFSAKIRQVAKSLGWEPAEAQAALWQAYRQLAIKSNAKGLNKFKPNPEDPTKKIKGKPTARQSRDIAKGLNEEDITGGVAFHTLFSDPEVQRHLGDKAAGYTYLKQIEDRDKPVERPANVSTYAGFTPEERKEVNPVVKQATKKYVSPQIVQQKAKQGRKLRFAAEGRRDDGSLEQPTASANAPGTPIPEAGGAEPSSAVMASPNVSEGLSFDQAYTRSKSGNQKAFEKITSGILENLGLKAKTHSAIGDWEHGAENSLYQNIPHKTGLSPQTVKTINYAAAWYGLLANQQSVLTFHAHPKGPDSLYEFDLPNGDLNKIREELTKYGISHRTLIPTKQGVKIVIYDQGRALKPQVAKFASAVYANPSESSGQGEFIGGSTRTGARAKYRKIIDDYEAQFEGSGGSSVQEKRKAILGNYGGLSHNGRDTASYAFSKRGRCVKFSGVQSPANGVIVRGVFYPGGKYIPKHELEKSTWNQYEQVAKRRNQLQMSKTTAPTRRGDGSYDYSTALKYSKEPQADMGELHSKVIGFLKKKRVPENMLEDVAQDTMLKIWKKLQEGYPIDNLVSFALQTAQNRTIDLYRRNKVRRAEPLSDQQSSNVENPVTTAINNERNEALNKGIAGLPEKQRKAVEISREGGKLKDIGKATGMGTTSAYRPLKQGIDTLSSQLKQYSLWGGIKKVAGHIGRGISKINEWDNALGEDLDKGTSNKEVLDMIKGVPPQAIPLGKSAKGSKAPVAQIINYAKGDVMPSPSNPDLTVPTPQQGKTPDFYLGEHTKDAMREKAEGDKLSKWKYDPTTDKITMPNGRVIDRHQLRSYIDSKKEGQSPEKQAKEEELFKRLVGKGPQAKPNTAENWQYDPKSSMITTPQGNRVSRAELFNSIKRKHRRELEAAAKTGNVDSAKVRHQQELDMFHKMVSGEVPNKPSRPLREPKLTPQPTAQPPSPQVKNSTMQPAQFAKKKRDYSTLLS